METFHTKTPTVSHLLAGDDKLAETSWEEGNSSLNALPVVGQTKKLGHYVCGDIEGGNKAMKAATRTTAMIGGGASGFLVVGPAGAVAGGVSVGAEWDLVVSAANDGKEINGIAKIIENPQNVDSYFVAGLSVFGDGLAGYSGGNAGPSETAVGGKADQATGGGEAGSAVASEKLAKGCRKRKITHTGYQQKLNGMKPQVDQGDKVVQQANQDIKYKRVSKNVPVSTGEANVDQAIKEMTKDGSKRMKVTHQYPVANSSGNQPSASSSGNQTPAKSRGKQLAEKRNGNNNGPNADGVRELRERLAILIERVAVRFMLDQENNQTLNYEEELQEFREWQRKIFHEIYKTILELFSYRHIARFDKKKLRLVISSKYDSWSEQIEYQLAGQLDVNDQLIDHEQFPLDRNPSCPTILSAQFGPDSRLVLSPQENHRFPPVTNVIYGIRCRLCIQNDPYEINAGNNRYINYVGQTAKNGLHNRVCNGHGGCIRSQISNKNVTGKTKFRPMYEHAANHIRNNDLPQGTQPQDAFRQVMDVILLPISSDGDLSSWERFWQFFCHCRTSFWGWSQRG